MLDKIEQWCASIKPEDLEYLIRQPYIIISLAALGILFLWLLYRLRPRRKIKAFKGDTGPVEISRHALLELVRSACEQLPEVRKPSIRIRPRRKLHLAIRIRVDGSARLRDTASFLQNHIKDALENNLGVENLGKIEVMVTGIRIAAPKKVDLNQREEKSTLAVAEEKPADPQAAAKPEKPSPAERQKTTPVSEDPASPKSPASRPDLNPSDRKPSSGPEKNEPKK